jgi:uncharacterized protein YndB with AHSA1/START domain
METPMDTIDRTALSLEISRRFEAPPERVFAAWLGPEWGEWLGPAGVACEAATLEPHAGGRFLFRMVMADGRNVEVSGVYREITPPQKLVFTFSGGCAFQETVVTVTFRPDGAGTLMVLRQDGFTEATMTDGFREGWSGVGGSFDKLAALLARHAS